MNTTRTTEPVASQFLVFHCNGFAAEDEEPDGDRRIVLWRPSPWCLRPPTAPWKSSLWSMAHYLRVFRNRDYAVLLIAERDKVIHRSSIVPAFFRWPFMRDGDLQISSTWTAPDYRGQGLATTAARKLLVLFRQPGREFWYVTRVNNHASVAVGCKAGFSYAGTAQRRFRLGTRLLGFFEMDSETHGDERAKWIA
jgi:RimJ/RimL family protein N-acetyltransferase